ncbi:MAG TPA: phosphatase PAP2 family protein [Rubricoccaceae bacterium]|jgi:undecaprenyl-diphosphatase
MTTETRPAAQSADQHAARSLTRGLLLAAGGAIAALAVFLLVVASVTTESGLYRFDARAHDVVYHAVGPQRQALAIGVTWFGNNATVTALVALVAAALVVARRRMLAVRVVIASGVGGLVVLGLKTLFQRARPLDQVIPATGYSLPSGHAWASAVFYGMMIYLLWRLVPSRAVRVLATAGLVALILAVGLSRVYLNVHFLTDVVAGWASGTAWLVGVLVAVRVAEERWAARRASRVVA